MFIKDYYLKKCWNGSLNNMNHTILSVISKSGFKIPKIERVDKASSKGQVNYFIGAMLDGIESFKEHTPHIQTELVKANVNVGTFPIRFGSLQDIKHDGPNIMLSGDIAFVPKNVNKTQIRLLTRDITEGGPIVYHNGFLSQFNIFEHWTHFGWSTYGVDETAFLLSMEYQRFDIPDWALSHLDEDFLCHMFRYAVDTECWHVATSCERLMEKRM
jgi:hypothetical protein